MQFWNEKRLLANKIRLYRKIHGILGASLFLVFMFLSVTGFLLGWKKHSMGLILPKSYQGTSTNLKNWLSIDSLHKIACRKLHDSVSRNLSLDLERIDVRKEKGMVKFVFIDHFWGIQLDGTTGNLLHIERRTSDIIENIHDGSIVDYCFDTKNEQFKLIYTTTIGLALGIFSYTGFWLWYGPKLLKRKSRITKLNEITSEIKS